ncbi:DoxX family protein [Paenibacillus silagei]|uniref:Membrane protein YphA (DoxX/SURF4 family) n=1 Tax=Paenibacillus silagei TaxID=1670801 RepID=A0ABS4NLY7_9BACL|nr:DoxX family protein [Paenibacillus silagei]MBP2110424.1 putative membrane protein YphA (DoxX/SURF4 family) [Paenibacillus silagei]
MNIVLWVLQIVLGAGFLYSGWLKAFQLDSARAAWSWVNDVPQGLVMGIGIAELLGVLGLILPMALRIQPQLTPLAAMGLAAAAGSGLVFHLLRGEPNVWINIIFIVLAVIITVGRFPLLQGR